MTTWPETPWWEEIGAQTSNANCIALRKHDEITAWVAHLPDGPEPPDLVKRWDFWTNPAQTPPEGDWHSWLFLGGRGAGKTRAGAEWLAAQVRRGVRCALIGPSLHDVREVTVRHSLTLDVDPLRLLELETGDGLTFEGDGRAYRLASVDQGETPTVTLEPVPEMRVFTGADPSLAGSQNAVVRQTIITGFRLLELPCFGVDEQNIRPVLVPSADIWAGVDVYAGAGAESLRRRGRVEPAAAIGRTLNALPVQRGHYLLRGASLDIYLEGEAPVSRNEADLLGGENVICVRALNGEWEMIQYLDVTALAVDCYRLSGLVRGQWGTEQARLAGMAAGAEVIILPAGFVRADMATDEIGLTRLWRTGRIGFGGAAENALDVSATWTGLALRPRAPVFGRVTGVGDLTISWLRSPRYGGDSWEAEPPLCEDYERYRVQVFDGADVVREVEVPEPVWVYGSVDRAVDFPGGFGAEARVEIAQKSQVYGFGPVLSLMLG